jgi:hypothetical protein
VGARALVGDLQRRPQPTHFSFSGRGAVGSGLRLGPEARSVRVCDCSLRGGRVGGGGQGGAHTGQLSAICE